MTDVSILLVNYNGMELLNNCIYSIINFTKEISYEIIVVDNNSIKDNIDEITTKFPRVRLIKNKVNRGFSAASNQALEVSTGKYVLFLNNDTYLIENSIKKTLDFLKSKNDKIIVGCRLLNADGTNQSSFADSLSIWNTFTSNFFLYKISPGSPFLNKYHGNYKSINSPEEVDYVSGAFLLCESEVAKDLCGFDERFFFYSEEMDFCYRFKKKGGKVYFFPGTSVFHLGGATAIKNPWFMYKNKSIATIQFYQKHFLGMKYFLPVLFHFTGLAIRSLIFFFMGIVLSNKNYYQTGKYYFKLLFVYPRNQFKFKTTNEN